MASNFGEREPSFEISRAAVDLVEGEEGFPGVKGKQQARTSGSEQL
jgi:hypothetical protein